MTQLTQRQREALKELVRRHRKKPTLRNPLFDKQNQAIDDQSKLRAWNCTRRAGKSTAAAIDLVETLEKYPGTKNLYLALSRESARGILWDEMKNMNDKAKLNLEFKEQPSLIVHPNGSSIKLFGIDANAKEMRKVLGQKYKKVFIDEAGSMTIDMEKLCYQMIEPSLMDLDGQLTLLGTCENIPNTFFEKITMGRENRWSVTKWTTADNPYLKDIWSREVANMLSENPKIVDASWFKTHYLNIWCQDDDLLIIPFSEQRNEISDLPSGFEWHYVLGVDLGYNDSTAFAVLAFSPYHHACYRVFGFKRSGLIVSKAGEEIERLRKQYDFHKIVIDGAAKQGVEDLKQRMKLPLTEAEKTGKPTYLKALKDDVVTGQFKVIKGSGDSLKQEWSQLQWVDMNQLKEDPRCQNHESDATLYAWRECRHYAGLQISKKAEFNTDEYIKDLEKEQAEQIKQQLHEEAEWIMQNLETY